MIIGQPRGESSPQILPSLNEECQGISALDASKAGFNELFSYS